MSIISYNEFPLIRAKHKNEKIVYCSGVFDLTHAGHILFLEESKKLGSLLVVCVGPDADAVRRKGEGRPVLNEHIRLKTVSALKPVDYCFLAEPYKENAHQFMYMEDIFKTLKPDIYVVNDDAFDIPFRKELTARHNIPMIILPRTCPETFRNISTTKIIESIKSNETL